MFIVDNLMNDERFKDKFYVNGGPRLSFYAGVSLISEDGFNIGALCVLDTKTMNFKREQKNQLFFLA